MTVRRGGRTSLLAAASSDGYGDARGGAEAAAAGYGPGRGGATPSNDLTTTTTATSASFSSSNTSPLLPPFEKHHDDNHPLLRPKNSINNRNDSSPLPLPKNGNRVNSNNNANKMVKVGRASQRPRPFTLLMYGMIFLTLCSNEWYFSSWMPCYTIKLRDSPVHQTGAKPKTFKDKQGLLFPTALELIRRGKTQKLAKEYKPLFPYNRTKFAGTCSCRNPKATSNWDPYQKLKFGQFPPKNVNACCTRIILRNHKMGFSLINNLRQERHVLELDLEYTGYEGEELDDERFQVGPSKGKKEATTAGKGKARKAGTRPKTPPRLPTWMDNLLSGTTGEGPEAPPRPTTFADRMIAQQQNRKEGHGGGGDGDDDDGDDDNESEDDDNSQDNKQSENDDDDDDEDDDDDVGDDDDVDDDNDNDEDDPAARPRTLYTLTKEKSTNRRRDLKRVQYDEDEDEEDEEDDNHGKDSQKAEVRPRTIFDIVTPNRNDKDGYSNNGKSNEKNGNQGGGDGEKGSAAAAAQRRPRSIFDVQIPNRDNNDQNKNKDTNNNNNNSNKNNNQKSAVVDDYDISDWPNHEFSTTNKKKKNPKKDDDGDDDDDDESEDGMSKVGGGKNRNNRNNKNNKNRNNRNRNQDDGPLVQRVLQNKGADDFGYLDWKVPGDWKMVIVLRNVYDSLISGYLYHKDGFECSKSIFGNPIKAPYFPLKFWDDEVEIRAPDFFVDNPKHKRRTLCRYLQEESVEVGMHAYIQYVFQKQWYTALENYALSQVIPILKDRTHISCYKDLTGEEEPEARRIHAFYRNQTEDRVKYPQRYAEYVHEQEQIKIIHEQIGSTYISPLQQTSMASINIATKKQLYDVIQRIDRKHYNNDIAWLHKTVQCL